MKVQLVHLSDIHFRSNGTNALKGREPAMAAAISAMALDFTSTAIVVTGDVAFSGTGAEYELASSFFKILLDELEERTGVRLPLIVVPGNHDCDFGQNNDVRDSLVENLKPGEVKPGVQQMCVGVQANFSKFCTDLEAISLTEDAASIHRTVRLKVGKANVRFELYNSAWMSTIHEKHGSLFIPSGVLPHPVPTPQEIVDDLVLALFHHPISWFTPEEGKVFRERLQATADVVFTGHEHEPASYSRAHSPGAQIEFVEGGVLQDSWDPNNSQFAVVAVDIEHQSFGLHKFEWQNDSYQSVAQTVSKGFLRNRDRLRQEFNFRDEFRRQLDSLGIDVSHPKIGQIGLRQVFVYPDVREMEVLGGSKVHGVVGVRALVAREKHVLLMGAEKSGKSTVARRLMLDLREEGGIPLLLQGADKKGLRSESAAEQWLQSAVEDQYGKDCWGEFTKLPVTKRILVVDDFHAIRMKKDVSERAVRYWMRLFDRVILLGSEESRWQDLAATGNESDNAGPLITDFSHAELLQFGHVKRSELVKRWFALGRGDEINENELIRRSNQAEATLTSLIGRSLVPARPVYCLILLQQLENQQRPDTSSGSQGYLYETLITASLARVARGTNSIDADYKYLSELAREMAQTPDRALSNRELEGWHAGYVNRFCINEDFGNRIELLLTSSILRRDEDSIRFSYPYLYYYFLARFLRDTLTSDETKQRVKSLCRRMHHEDASNVMIFLCYLSKDPFVIDTMLDAARETYADVEECNLPEQTAFLARLDFATPELAIDLATDHDKNRREELARQDEEAGWDESESVAIEPVDFSDAPESDDEIDELMKIAGAIKTVQVLGQVLRNFSGSLEGARKIELCKECMSLSFRVAGRLMGMIQTNGQEIIADVAKWIHKLHPESSRKQVAMGANAFVFGISERALFGIMKHLSQSVGLEELEPVYGRVLKDKSDLTYQIADVTIQMDHFSEFPMVPAQRVYRTHSNNRFIAYLMRHIVWHHMYIMPVSYQLRQSLSSTFEISSSNKLIENRQRMVPSKSGRKVGELNR